MAVRQVVWFVFLGEAFPLAPARGLQGDVRNSVVANFICSVA
jgi:hypothetical protein